MDTNGKRSLGTLTAILLYSAASLCRQGMAGSPTLVKDRLCVPKKSGGWVCGSVIENNSNQTTAAFNRSNGERLYVIFGKNKEEESSPKNNIGFAMSLGGSYILPSIHYQRALSPKFAMGLSATYISAERDGVQQSAIGGFLTASYFLNQASFRGFYLQGQLGAHSIKASQNELNEEALRPTYAALVGWRGTTRYSINLGLSVGAQYVAPTGNLSLVNFAGVLPFFGLDVSFSF